MRTLPVSSWLDQLDQFPVILVPNQRLIRVLQQYLKQQAAQQAFQAPLIVTPWQWLHRCAEESLLSGTIPAEQWPQRILTKNQASLVWHQVIPTDFPRSVIAQAMSASQLCFEWGIEVDYPTAEFEHFSTWQTAFNTQCEQHGWQDETGWHQCLLNWLQQGLLHLPEQLLWAEFDSVTPVLAHVQQQLDSQHCHQYALSFSVAETAEEIVVPCANAEQELYSAAHWCKTILEKMPRASIAVVVPDLTQRRVHVQTVFDKVLQPERRTSFDLEAPRRFNISAAAKLNEYGIIKTALIILHSSQPDELIEFDQLSELLRSPYFGEWPTFHARARLEAALRRKISREFTLNNFIQQANRLKFATAETWQKWLQLITEKQPLRMGFQEWALHFTQLLNLLGWPGSRGLSSHEYQIVQRFQQVLAEFSALSAVQGPVRYNEAVSWLQRLLADISFQPKTEQEPRIQVLGVLEALGQAFDAIWLCGLHDTAWPGPAKPHPLIPVAAQKKVNAPHSSAQRELHYARETLQHFKQHTLHFVVSYPQWQEDQALHPSRLLTGTEHPSLAYIEAAAFQPVAGVWLEDWQAPAVFNHELSGIKGGTAILEAQAKCPLWAFIEYRLHATELEQPERYVGARERGSLLHSTLELIWRELKEQSSLLSRSRQEREQLIIRCAEQAIQNTKLKLSPAQRDVEITRLIKYIQAWLDLECEREPFGIEQLEYELNESLAGLPLKIRIDRVDQIEPGIRLVLDYKSSSKKELKPWFSERITDVQLPLYACFLDADAISFALITHSPAFKGLSQYVDLFPGAETSDKYCGSNEELKNWQALKMFWKQQLTLLAQEFMSGHAANRFNKNDIEFCKVKPLLREAERTQQWLAGVDQPGANA